MDWVNMFRSFVRSLRSALNSAKFSVPSVYLLRPAPIVKTKNRDKEELSDENLSDGNNDILLNNTPPRSAKKHTLPVDLVSPTSRIKRDRYYTLPGTFNATIYISGAIVF